MKTKPEKVMYKVRTVAEMLDCCPATVRKWIDQGVQGEKLPVIRLPGGGIRVDINTALGYIERFNTGVRLARVDKKVDADLRRHGIK